MNYISEDLSIIEMNKTKVKMNKPIYLGLSILDISKILTHEFWYDYMKPKYNDNVKLCYMDTDSFVMNIKTKDLSSDVDKIYLYAKDLSEPKYEFLINNRKNAGIKHFNDSTAFIEYSNDMDDVFTNIDDYNKKRKGKVLIVFDDMIADIMSSNKFKAIIKEILIRCRKLNISIVFITQSYFRTPKDAKLNSTHFIIMKIQCRKELQNIAQEN